jgi:hypothetical protein
MKKRNPVAQELRTPKFRKRVVENKKKKEQNKTWTLKDFLLLSPKK